MATTYPAEFRDSSGLDRFNGSLVFTGATPATPGSLNQVSPVGTITSGALPTITVVSGTQQQVSTTRDADLYLTLIGSATSAIASATIQLSPDNSTFSTVYSVSLAAAVNNTGAIQIPAVVRVPAGWYVKITLSNMTLGNSNYA